MSCTKKLVLTLFFVLAVTNVQAQEQGGTWQIPGEIQKPSDNWQVPGEIQKPSDNWQVPGEIQKPSDKWQVPGEIAKPKGIRSIIVDKKSNCTAKLEVNSDTLFTFDKADLTVSAQETLAELLPILASNQVKSLRVEGHTDSKGSDDYNLKLSEARALRVKEWFDTAVISQQDLLIKSVSAFGFGEQKPIAANSNPDGSDNPEGRQKNRRVDIIVSRCE